MRAARSDDHVHLTADQLGRQRRQSITSAIRPAEFDGDVLALDKAGFMQAPAKGGDIGREPVGRLAVEEAYDRHRPLLRACGEGPDRWRGRAAEKCDELPPSHSITSSARSRIDCGMMMPSALAVWVANITKRGRLALKSQSLHESVRLVPWPRPEPR